MHDQRYLRRIYWQLAGATLASVIAALGVVSFFSQNVFERELVPETESKALTVGASLRGLVLKATGPDTRLESLYGVEETFDEILSSNPELASIAITDAKGVVLYARGKEAAGARAYYASPAVLRTLAEPDRPVQSARLDSRSLVSLPIVGPADVRGILHIGIDSAFVNRMLLEVLLNVLIVLVVSFFFTLELLSFLAGVRLTSGLRELSRQVERVAAGDFRPSGRVRVNDEIGRLLRWIDAAIDHINVRYQQLSSELRTKLARSASRASALQPAVDAMDRVHARLRFGSAEDEAGSDEDADLSGIRAPLFVLILAEELTRSLLPAYLNELQFAGISPQVVIGLPIMLFMLIVALGQPYLGSWSERLGRRKLMLTGAALAMAGFAATTFAYTLYDLTLWRSLSALGYATVFIAAQGYILDRTRPDSGASGFPLLVGAILVAAVCGPSIGGILAENIGIRASFAVSASLAALSIAAIARLPRKQARTADETPVRKLAPLELVSLVRRTPFLALSILTAIPARMLLTGACFFLLPLHIVSDGNIPAGAVHVLMVYAITMVLVVPIVTSLSDAGSWRERYVGIALMASGLAGFVVLFSDSLPVLFGVVFLMSAGLAASIAAQSALIGMRCQPEIDEFGADAVYGACRSLERFGNVLGPVAAGVLMFIGGYKTAFITLSALALAGAVAFTIVSRTGALRAPRPEDSRA